MTKNMAKRLENKVCIITGSANGIGFATAQKFCDEGGISIICDMNDAQVQAAVNQLKSAGGQADGFVMNVTNRKNIDEVVAAVIERYGRIDVLINNAGITKDARLVAIVNGATTFAGKKAKIANVGWCFGGSWSLKSALLGGKQTIGSVMYYGMPVKDVEKLKTLNSDVLGLFATEQYISQQVIEDFAANMKTANKKLTYKIFNAVHGFSNPSNPKYDEAASKEAYSMAIGYLKEKYKL